MDPNGTKQVGDTCCDVRQVSKTINRTKRIKNSGRKYLISCWCDRWRERKGSKDSFSDPRSFVCPSSSDQELKFIYSMRATRMYQNRRISPKIQKRRFREIKGVCIGSILKTSYPSSTLQEVGIFPTQVHFHPKGLILGEMLCKGPKGLFG